MKLLGFINGTYKVDSIKNMSRQNREIFSTKFKITGFQQNMPQGNNWQKLLNDSEYKYQSIEMIKQYILEFVFGILPRTTPFIITSTGNEYYVSPAENQVISGCNHEDSGTRLVLHGSKVATDVVVVCKDTVVYTLMIWAYSKLNITNNWYLKYDHEKFADIRKICSYLGKTLSMKIYRRNKTKQDAIPYLIFTELGKLKYSKNYLLNKIYVFFSHS